MKNGLATEPTKLESKQATPEKRDIEPVKSAKHEPQESSPAKPELESAKLKPETERTPALESAKEPKRETEPTPVSEPTKQAQPPPTPKVSIAHSLPGS